MADRDGLPTSLQESILTALAFDDKHGALIAAQVRIEHFDDDYRDVASRILSYRATYRRAPGMAHLDDVFANALQKGDQESNLRRVMLGLVSQAEGLNGEYVANQAQHFIRRQLLKTALVAAGERYHQGGDDIVEDVERILYDALGQRQVMLDAGLSLDDPRGLDFLERRRSAYSINIAELDRQNIGPAPKEMLLYIAPKGTGKSWFCVHCGKLARQQRAKVLHLSLEMDELQVFQRYYQSFFAIAKDSERYPHTTLELDELKHLSGFQTRQVVPKLDLTDPNIKKILRKHMKQWGVRLGGLIIKAFPTGSLTVAQLDNYLDYLETTKKFIPTMLIVDYPDLMRIDMRDYRHSLGNTYEQLRGRAVKHNMALVVPTQGQRTTLDAKRVRSSHVGEDISKVFTADIVLTYSRTAAEERRGLGRLYVNHARDARDHFSVVLTQSYATGQYVLESTYMNPSYWEKMKRVPGDVEGDDEEQDYKE